MGSQNPQYLVETDWLHAHLDDADLRVLDCTVYLPNYAGGRKAGDAMQANLAGEMYASYDLTQRERDTARFAAQRRALREAEPGGRGQRRAPAPWS
jgi:3-mercaptopyruvate sulfurtransferase SseA